MFTLMIANMLIKDQGGTIYFQFYYVRYIKLQPMM